ncbi:MAG TPA: D-aminoacyl-tRNA deacylase [Archaeoglobus profundus]|nr:D-aminoacyl-tRNA deacylase [Archaeoglobus profundus]
MHLIVCSNKDVASQNIKSHLIEVLDVDKKILPQYTFYDGGKIGIVEIDKDLIYADYLDEQLKRQGLSFSELLFISRHSSKDKRKLFTVHVSGNVGTADYGGKPYSLAKPCPIRIKNYVMALKKRLDRKPEFQFSLEVTHHGPSEISTPSAFFEIGSSEEEWKDEEAGRIVAESLIEAINDQKSDWHIAVGVGGTHYAPRQTELILETTFTFGHNFAKYTFNYLNKEILIKAVEISNAKYIVIDEKSVTSTIKSLVRDVAEQLNIEVIKTKEVKKMYKLL